MAKRRGNAGTEGLLSGLEETPPQEQPSPAATTKPASKRATKPTSHPANKQAGEDRSAWQQLGARVRPDVMERLRIACAVRRSKAPKQEPSSQADIVTAALEAWLDKHGH